MAVELRKYDLSRGPEGLLYIFDRATLHPSEADAYNYVASELAREGQGGLFPVLDGEIPVVIYTTIEVQQVSVTMAAGPVKDDGSGSFPIPDSLPPPDGFEDLGVDTDDDEEPDPA